MGSGDDGRVVAGVEAELDGVDDGVGEVEREVEGVVVVVVVVVVEEGDSVSFEGGTG